MKTVDFVELLLQRGPILLVFALLGFSYAWNLTTRTRKKLPLPPGPRRLPIIGNLLDLPSVRPWITYSGWANRYKSDVVFVQLPFQPVVIVNSFHIAQELMEKRSHIYSDKAVAVMDILTGWEWNLALQAYGPRWRTVRRYFHQYFHQNIVHNYHPTMLREVHSFLRRALANSGIIDERSVSQIFATLIMDVVYGIPIKGMNDGYVVRMEAAGAAFGKMKVPGAFWADSFPLLRHIPGWAPGGSARRFGDQHRATVLSCKNEAFDTVKREMASGVNKQRIAHHYVEHLDQYIGFPAEYEFQELCARDAAGIAYVGAVETSLSSTSWFLLAMATHSAVQKKAQQELDHVLGPNSLPTCGDLQSLPYCRALFLEVLRWRPALPLGVPHRVMVDDEYNGYRIPAGSLIVPNTWEMLHNPHDYPEPEVFNPDRFLKEGSIDPDVQDPSAMAFGFGRRACAGRHFAADALSLTFISILSVFDVFPAADENGQPVQVDVQPPEDGMLLHPRHLSNCVLKLRSEASERLIRDGTNLM